MGKISLGQLGVGYWGPNLVRNLVRYDGIDKIWICDKDEGRSQKIKDLYNGKIQIEKDVEALLKNPDISGIVIALPAKDHFAFSKKALEAGKHVLVEKPLAMSKEEAETLTKIAKEKNLVLMVGHTFLYNAAVRKIKELIDEGVLGDVYYLFSQRLNLGRVREDVNVLWNLAPHDISIILYWLGEEPSEIQAKGLSFLQPGIEDVAFLNLDFPSGKSAHVHVSWLDPSKTRKVVIVGSKKMLVYDDVSSDGKIKIFDKGIDKKNIIRDLPDIQSFGQFQLMQRVGDVTIPKIEFEEPLNVECRHFVECILENRKPISDGENGAQVVSVLEKADLAMKS